MPCPGMQAVGLIHKQEPTMNRFSTTLSALVLATTAHAAGAQSTPSTGSTPIPAARTAPTQAQAVGVSPQAASTAQQQAIPRSDTATVVRTGPSAADKASRDGRQVKASGAGASRAAASGAMTAGELAPRADRH